MALTGTLNQMEADWEIEVGGSAPVIDANWSGLVDLRAEPGKALDLMECRQLPALAGVLIKLNGAKSPVWTSKTDVFEPDYVDPYEVDAAGGCGFGLSCYIDMLAKGERWRDHGEVERDCAEICDRLHGIELRWCRVDLIIRRAYFFGSVEGFGTTAYLTGCGKELETAKARLAECLEAFVGVLVPEA